MTRYSKPRSRIHLAYARVHVQRFARGVLSKAPITSTEIRLVNTGKDYRDRPNYNRNTSRCFRTRLALAVEGKYDGPLLLKAKGQSLLQKAGSALAGLARG